LDEAVRFCYLIKWYLISLIFFLHSIFLTFYFEPQNIPKHVLRSSGPRDVMGPTFMSDPGPNFFLAGSGSGPVQNIIFFSEKYNYFRKKFPIFSFLRFFLHKN
jgi:hypothetical protein